MQYVLINYYTLINNEHSIFVCYFLMLDSKLVMAGNPRVVDVMTVNLK